MSRKNYNKMYNNPTNAEETKVEAENVVSELEEVVVEEAVEAVVEETVEEVVEEAVEQVIVPAPVVKMTAVVVDCGKLNVRQHPDSKANVLTTLNVSDEVVVSVNESVENYYRVCTAAGIEGYCVKDYLKLK